MGDVPNPFGVMLKSSNNKFSQEIRASSDVPISPSKPAPKAVGKPPPKPVAKALSKQGISSPKPAAKAPPPKPSATPIPPTRETEKLLLDTETKIPPPSKPDPFKNPAKDSSLNIKEEHKEEITEPIVEVKQFHETPVMASHNKDVIELLDTEDSSTDSNLFDESDEDKLEAEHHPSEHKLKHRSHHHHHHHHHRSHRENKIPQPYNFIPPYNDNYRYCYYYHLPAPPPSLMKKFKAQAKARPGYYTSPFNEKYLVPPALLHIPGHDSMPTQQSQHTSFSNRAFSKPPHYYI